ncbi:phage tail length tape measure family protein [Paradevosia shaoguanensis]|uniref:Phage tail length tape measure family protein n=1 Tax=Paradevosia shaoguanensis TaxID=1335043 RepID=A0AA41QL12_9HYPH|nr:phage tail length tape measure family protein [Paradevosia shaoguanensis]MCF1741256.1 phage tail length tape measure family protein [Paradevosia shaoguanensis]MCI0125739.1 phage tail length tape measure family protein [Paradevosia shaoguanensis]
MALMVSLEINGDASKAVQAARATEDSLKRLDKSASLAELDTARLEARTRDNVRAQELARRAFNDNAAAAQNYGKALSTNLNTANIAAQFQDIAVTSAMGMSPLQIALQQGTQLSAVLGSQGAAGAARALGGALMSIVSPVSLLTLGLVGASAAALQFFGGAISGAQDTTDALKEHESWLEKILQGYQGAQVAANKAAEEAVKLPRASVDSELSSELDNWTKKYRESLDAIRSFNTKRIEEELQYFSTYDNPVDNRMIAQARELESLQAAASKANPDLNAVHSALTRIINSKPDETIRALASEFLDLVNRTREFGVEVQRVEAGLGSLRTLSVGDWMKGNGGLLGVDDAIAKMKQLTPEVRSVRAQVTDLFNQSVGQARSSSEVGALVKQYDEFISAMEKKDAEAAAKTAARSSQKVSDYARELQAINERTQALLVEADTVGLSTRAAEKARAQLQLENAAKRDSIGLTTARVTQIANEAIAYANAQVALEARTAAFQRATEEFNFYRDTNRSFFADLRGELMNGSTLWDAFGQAGANALNKIADRALGMAADGIFDLIFGGLNPSPSSSFGGGLGGLIAGLFGHNAKGTDYWTGGYTWVGEKGPELMKLPGGTQILSNSRSMAMAASVVASPPANLNSRTGGGGITINMPFSPVINVQGNGGNVEGALAAARKALYDEFPQVYNDAVRRAKI